MRPETEKLYRWAKENDEYGLQMIIAFYIHDGWDYYWAFTDMPEWLKPRYL